MFKKIIITGLSTISIFTLGACNIDMSGNDNATPVTKPIKEQETTKEEAITLPDKELQKGDQGKDVKALQEALIELDYPIKLTSDFDEITVWAMTDLQFQTDELDISGLYDEQTKCAIEKNIKSENPIKPGKGIAYKKSSKTKDGKVVTGNPYDALVLVNKGNALPDDFLPEDLVIPNVRFPFTEDLPKKQMRKIAADALEDMFEASDEENLELFAQSGFRSFDRQEAIFAANVEKNGEEAANKYSARPGESEHQSGLTMDVTNADVNFDLLIEFGETPEGEWLKDNASKYGFIIRYPEDMNDITGYQYEPWHLRYVGEKAAKEIMGNNITFEDYIDEL